MSAWLGMRTYMSLIHMPDVKMYWGDDWLFGRGFLSNIMGRDRFEKISQYLHVNSMQNNPARNQPGHDKLCHVRPLLDHLLNKCSIYYNAHKNVSIDEAMVAFRGRLSFKQYLPSKPTKYGIKIWVRADPENGYVNQFQVYTGRENGQAEFGLGARVVRDMTSGILNRGHVVNVDNYFSSPALFQELLDGGTYARGTIKANRKGFPQGQLGALNMRGDFKVLQKNEMTAMSWKDKRTVHMLSTAENPISMPSSVPRKQRDGTQIQVPCPRSVPEYNDHMNGVDISDQLRTQYSTYRKSKKWWQYLFWFCFDLAMSNAFILMKESPNHIQHTRNGGIKSLTLLDYRKSVAKSLIGNFRVVRKRQLPPTADPTGTAHWPIAAPKARCRWCQMQGRRAEPRLMCSGCQKNLCIGCFLPYHIDLEDNGA